LNSSHCPISINCMASVLLLRWLVGWSFGSQCTHFLITYCVLSEGAVFMLTSFSRFSTVCSWYCFLCLWKAGFFCVYELASRLDEALHKLSAVFPLKLTPCCIVQYPGRGATALPQSVSGRPANRPTELFRESVKLRAEGDVKCGCLQRLTWRG
jgi:hypothetical protein